MDETEPDFSGGFGEVEIRNKTQLTSTSSAGDSPLRVSENMLSMPETRLEGWLKLVGGGFRKTGKQLWFVYGEGTGKLYYYGQPQDIMPDGEIDMRCSSLTYDAGNRDKQGLFEIRSGGKVYSLDAQECAHKLYWLEALQKKRRAFSAIHTQLAHELLTGKTHLSGGGLLGEASAASDGVLSQSLPTKEPGNMVSTIHSVSPDEEKYGNDSPSTPGEDDFIVSDRPSPPSSLPLVNNFNTHCYSTENESSPDSACNETPVISSGCYNQTDISDNYPDDIKVFSSQSNSSQTSPAVTSQQLPFDQSETLTASPLSPPFANPKLKFMSVLRNNFKVMKDSAKERKTSTSVKYRPSTTPESAVDISSSCLLCEELSDELQCVKEKLKATEKLLERERNSAERLLEEMNLLKDVLNARKEFEGKNEDDIMQVLCLKEQHVTELENSREALLDEKNILVMNLRQSDKELDECREQIAMFLQTLEVKDEMIINLTYANQELLDNRDNGGADLGDNAEVSTSVQTGPASVTADKKEFDKLTHMCKSYEDQNKFLTKEILEQNALRQDDEAREKPLRMLVKRLEAQCCEVRSKYLYLLNEVQAPVQGDEENNNLDVVNELIQEALESESEPQDGDESRRNIASFKGKEYDHFGFLKFWHEDDNLLMARANFLHRQSIEIEYHIKYADEEASKNIRWENFMVGHLPNKQLVRSADLKILLRLGIPHQFRESIWKGCINLYVRPTRTKLGEKYYQSLAERAKKNKSNPAFNQIELDLLRTLPNNKYFDKIDCPGIRKLRRILRCYSVHNPVIGYCQGINRLAAVALLFLGEEDAFWCLVAVIDHLMPVDYYTISLAAAQADQRVLKDLVQEKCPKLHAHLAANDVDLSFFTFSWFLTVFVDGVCPDLFLRIWDVFLYEGNKILFRFAIACLKYGEDEILKLPNSLAINRYMKTLAETITDVRRIYTIAFSELNSFPMRAISNKRHYHLQQVKLELEEMDKMRVELKPSREEVELRWNRQHDLCEDDGEQ